MTIDERTNRNSRFNPVSPAVFRGDRVNLPHFLCIGAQRCGTTSLFEILRTHPDIYVPPAKEIHFFDDDRNFHRGLRWYADFFREARDGARIGEVTPAYIFIESAPERIRDALGPETKLVLVLRNPIDRAYSHYWFEYAKGREPLSFSRAVAGENERLGPGGKNVYWYSYIKRGLYHEQIARYLKFFPKENLKVIVFEELQANMLSAVNEILRFLGCRELESLPVIIKKNSTRLNAPEYLRALWLNRASVSIDGLLRRSSRYPALSRAFRHLLAGVFHDDIIRLQSLLDRDFSVWREESK